MSGEFREVVSDLIPEPVRKQEYVAYAAGIGRSRDERMMYIPEMLVAACHSGADTVCINGDQRERGAAFDPHAIFKHALGVTSSYSPAHHAAHDQE